MWQTGYCTNIHAGIDLAAILQNLEKYSLPVRELAFPGKSLGVGLWIPNEAANDLTESNCERLRETLHRLHLDPYTINGFPFGNFHQPVVKHKVYLPTWADSQRESFTQKLASILHRLLPENAVGSISTLPLGWGVSEDELAATKNLAANKFDSELAIASGRHLRSMSEFLRQLESDTGRRIVVAIEPEPGCMLDTSEDICNFFDRHLSDETNRRYITVCHDICHAAVMNEPQNAVIERYIRNGLTIGKVQVSSAIEVRWDELDTETGKAALNQLHQFAEDRYLHQTGVVSAEGHFRLVDDLPSLLAETPSKPNDLRWRIHFHVPIFLEQFGYLSATRPDVLSCLTSLSKIPAAQRINHLEVETYAWSVLPESMRDRSLAQSIASELIWLEDQIANQTGLT